MNDAPERPGRPFALALTPLVLANDLARASAGTVARAVADVGDRIDTALDGASDAVESRANGWRDEAERVVGSVAAQLQDRAEDVSELVSGVGEFVEEHVEALPEFVDGGRELVADVVEEGTDLVEDTLGTHRRVWEDEDGDQLEIEVHGVDEPGARGLRRRLREAVEQLEGVEWAEVNAITSRIAVGLSGGPVDLIVAAVETVEDAHGVRRKRRAEPRWEAAERAEHPSDDEPVHRAIAAMTGDVLAIGYSIVGRAARLPRIPVELAGILPVIDNHPALRDRLEQVLGRRTTQLVMPLGNALANGASQGPTGAIVDLGYQASLLGELRARQHVWAQRADELYAAADGGEIAPPDLEPRPLPLPHGPVESWSERISASSLAGFAVSFALTRDVRRSTDAFLAGIPKAARLGREGFAAQLGRTLAYRGVVPLDGEALRRLDRVDTVVVDSDVLVADEHEVTRVAWADEGVDAEATVDRLLDARDPGDRVSRGGWILAPFDSLEGGVERPRGTTTRARELRASGLYALALVRGRRVRAVVGVRRRLDPGAELVLRAIRDAGHTFVIAGRKGGLDRRLGPDAVVPRGKAMGRAVRDLQADGAGVMVIARRGKTGLAAADVAVGLVRRSGRPPWGADLVFGRELAETALIVDASVVAHAVSRRSARFALGGSALGALVALTGPRASAGRRCLTIVNGAAGASLLAGTWAAISLAHQPRPRPPARTAWHALPAEAVLRRLDAGLLGLSTPQARQRKRSRRADEPELGSAEPFLAELANPLNPILAGGAALAAAAGSMLDAWLVIGLIGVNGAVGGIQRLRADREIARLLERTTARARVLRDGALHEVPEDDLVPGDVIVLEVGDVVPADCRILEAADLEADESSLTGESLPVAKGAEPTPGAELADRTSMLYEDAVVAAGSARAVVVAGGADTELSRAIADAGAPPASGVEARLSALSERILPASLATAGVVAGVGMLRRWPLREVAGTGVSLAIASVPEGLPFVSTAAQLAAARRLATRGAVVRDPRAIEALGRVEVLCIDKTGTLTEGRMRLRLVTDGLDTWEPTANGLPGEVLATAARATPPSGDDGNPTDRAIVEAAERAGVEAGGWEVEDELPFEASRGLHAIVARDGAQRTVVVKGAPEEILRRCTRWRPGGTTQPLDRATLGEVDERADAIARSGFRVLAIATGPVPDGDEPLDDDTTLADLELVGLLALADPVRATARDALDGIRGAGVRAMMVTGDHPDTAAAIADELGIGGRVLTGPEIDALDDEALAARLDEVAVIARVTPAAKVRIVQRLQAGGRAVAMTGDGANDAPAIRLADVGVALGRRATPAARDAADLVVTDDRVETLIDAVTEGRALWGSVREALGVLLGGNLGEIGFTLSSSLFSRRAPISGRQFLLVNLLTDLAPAVAIAVRPPRDRSPEALRREGPSTSLGSALTRSIAVRATATGTAATGAWAAARVTGTAQRAGTVGLVSLVGTQLGQTLLAGGAREPLVVATSAGSLAALAAIVQTPVLSGFFGCRPLGPLGWSQAMTASAVGAVGGHVAGRVLRSD
ncbi:HAD family hydrolase [Egibacter rhizosphaerae]|uniref:HAD family hydrolase n=1 Tax=Egibacter rhizosphaerae TaxID=1670831 RepID=A0A411YKC3_9ACTN|nr:HAD-IC family P-type ATPase [Egibacter rhizosphaerae]QBI21637.1 HAD family hydrolase [Egibacter rhizosphaerae]